MPAFARLKWRAIDMPAALDALEPIVAPGASLAVLPEGVMLNYLLRRETPLPFVNFMPPEVLAFGEDAMVHALERHPPDIVVFVHRDTSEYGFELFGTDPEYGRRIMTWIRARYGSIDVIGHEPMSASGAASRFSRGSADPSRAVPRRDPDTSAHSCPRNGRPDDTIVMRSDDMPAVRLIRARFRWQLPCPWSQLPMRTTSLRNPYLSLSGATRGWSIRATPATLCRATLWAVLAVLVTNTSADADLWGHLRFGLDMLALKSIHASDLYSFTADRAWINHEWLSELLMGIGYTGLGALGLNCLKLGVVAAVGAIALIIARQEHAGPIARDLDVALTVFATYSRTQVIRPQMFSVAIFCAMLYLLRETTRGRARALWCVPLCFVAWVNLHGGWIVGLAALGVWMLGDAWQRRSMRWTIVLTAVGALALLATLINPYGLGLWQFLGEQPCISTVTSRTGSDCCNFLPPSSSSNPSCRSSRPRPS